MDKRVPEVRFKGFTDDWEQQKLGCLYKVNKEKNGSLFESNKTISISSMKFHPSGNGAKKESIPNYKVLRLGDIAYEGHKSNEFSFGRFVLNDIGDGIMSPRFSTLRPLNNTNMEYWKYYIHYEPIMRHILVNSTKLGTMMNELVPKDLFKQKINVPISKEQKKIGHLLATLDNSIALYQKKLSLYKKIRQSLLQTMFPKDGEKVPKVRFADFHDDWKQFKLGEITREITERSSDGQLLSVTIKNGIQKANTTNRKDNSSKDKSNYKKVCIKDIAYNSMRMWQGASGVSNYNGIVSPAYTVIGAKKDLVNSKFLGYLLKLPDMIWQFRTHSQGLTSDTWNLKYPSFSKIKLYIPSLPEQEIIVYLLESIDEDLSIQSNKIEELMELKKMLLQKMFI